MRYLWIGGEWYPYELRLFWDKLHTIVCEHLFPMFFSRTQLSFCRIQCMDCARHVT